jgi:hypothetical protein
VNWKFFDTEFASTLFNIYSQNNRNFHIFQLFNFNNNFQSLFPLFDFFFLDFLRSHTYLSRIDAIFESSRNHFKSSVLCFLSLEEIRVNLKGELHMHVYTVSKRLDNWTDSKNDFLLRYD